MTGSAESSSGDAGRSGGATVSTGRWRKRCAAEEDVHAQNRRSSPNALRAGPAAAPDRALLLGLRRLAPERYSKAAPDFAAVHEQLAKHKHVTLRLPWEEYFEQQLDSYRYSLFCKLYRRRRRELDVVPRQQHRAGEKLFVDYAGATAAVENPRTGELRQAQIFVAVLGARCCTYAEAACTQQLRDGIGSHVRAFELFSGAPEIVVKDNPRAGKTAPDEEAQA